MTITCTAGDLQASGIDSLKACGSIKHVVVKGGDGDDTIDVSAVTHAAFPVAAGTTMMGARVMIACSPARSPTRSSAAPTAMS